MSLYLSELGVQSLCSQPSCYGHIVERREPLWGRVTTRRMLLEMHDAVEGKAGAQEGTPQN